MDIRKVIRSFSLRKSEEVAKKKMLQILELLGGISEAKKAAIEDNTGDQKPDERIDPKKLNEERHRKLEKSKVWNDVFREKLVSHLFDDEGLNDIKFTGYIFTIMQRRVGLLSAVNFIEDAISFILKDMDTLIHTVLKGKRINKDPLITIRSGKWDQNKGPLQQPGYVFYGEVLSRSPSDPFSYQIKVSGKGLDSQEYRADASGSMLSLMPKAKYKMEISSVRGDLTYIRVPHAERELSYHPLITVEQIKPLLSLGTTKFLQTEYESLIGDAERIEKEKVRTDRKIEKIEDNLKRMKETGSSKELAKLQKSLHTLRDRANKLEDLGMKGVAEFETGKGIREIKEEPMFETPETIKHRDQDPYTRWYSVNYTPFDPEKGKIDVKQSPYGGGGDSGPTEEDAERIRNDLMQAAKGEIRGVPTKEILRIMWAAIMDAPEPGPNDTTLKGWKGKFTDLLEDYGKRHKIPGLMKSRRILETTVVDEIIGETQQMIMHDEKFRRLKDNFTKALVRQKVLAAENMEEQKSFEKIKEHLEILLHNPVMNEKELSGIYFDAAFKMQPKDFRQYVEVPTKEGFNKILEKDLKNSLTALISITDDLEIVSGVKFVSFTDQLKAMFLREVVYILLQEVDENGQVIELDYKIIQEAYDLFKEYKEEYQSGRESTKIQSLRKQILDSFKKLKLEILLKLKTPKGLKQKPKGPRTKKVVPPESESITRERDKDLIKELESIF